MRLPDFCRRISCSCVLHFKQGSLVMFNWYEALDDVKKRMTELENRITIVRGELQRAQRETDRARAQRLLAVREQELERAKGYVEFIEHKLATSPFRVPRS